MSNVYCYAEIIPEAVNSSFTDSIVKRATLHVPATALDAYCKTYPWKCFGNIVALTDSDPKPTGITGIENVVTTEEQYYILDGKCLEMPKRGLNIIHMNNGKTKKVVVK